MYADAEKLFAFSLGEESLKQLAAVSARYAMMCLDRPFKTLEFLETVL